MVSPSMPKKSWLDKVNQDIQSNSSTAGFSRDTGGRNAYIPRSTPDANGAQTLSQKPAPSLVVTPAGMRPREWSSTSVSTSGPSSLGSRNSDNVSRADGTLPNEVQTPRMMDYPAHAIFPETPEELSIYPVTPRMLRIPISPEASTDPHIDLALQDSLDPELDLQYQVRKASDLLWAEKNSKMLPPSRPAAADSNETSPPDGDTGHQSDVEEHDGDSPPREETKNTRKVLHESLDWDNEADPADLDKDFSMFDETPRDQSILPEIEEWLLPPWEPSEPDHTPSLSKLSSMTEWDPENDLDFQIESQQNLERLNDCRFKVPETSSDIESLQRALEITRMDFWIRNPSERYPEDLSQYKRESYGSQQRRLQHAFCRIWREIDLQSPPELYRLPVWMFGFENCYWKPSTWGNNRLSRAYNEGLAEMAAEKNEKGLQSVQYQEWKARLEERLIAVTAGARSLPALYAAPEGRK
ncbi:MAG: hypothetical protein ALECFALPRED_004049 [Alectoria fallacina]|uniref:Uncharacterized protein n=1 Tax=Alectoria fallacina TaxID=1903189 RepID=A0A8H3FVZ8_9LECA|nr:MAG: hypothetical protein ALECFALPRED_004049 [Alectoria fallacina]